MSTKNPTSTSQSALESISSGTELVLGLVAPVGADLEGFCDKLGDKLREFEYEQDVIRLSEFIHLFQTKRLGVELKQEPEIDRLKSHMKAGTRIRELSERDDIFSLCSITEIARRRKQRKTPARTAYVLRTLKNPDEVNTLRRVYGPGFFLVGVYVPKRVRVETIRHLHRLEEAKAKELVEWDENEQISHGQRVEDTFQLSDVFIPCTGPDTDRDLERFLDLLFGYPFGTPTRPEHAMFTAYSASLKSGSLSRQVGAVIVSEKGDLLAAGANDTPKAHGGQYWADDEDDQRDYVKNFDSNEAEKSAIIDDVLALLNSKDYLKVKALRDRRATVRMVALRSKLGSITEYGRDVHAEMEALLSCARTGRSTLGATLYTTTFPCHNCAKHIIDAGIRKVVFVEPYPKSKARDLHSDAVRLAEDRGDGSRVVLTPFVGIGPRRYFDFFSLALRSGPQKRRKSNGDIAKWKRNEACPAWPLPLSGYREAELWAIDEIQRLRSRMSRGKVK